MTENIENFDIEESLRDVACRLGLMAKLFNQPNETEISLSYSEKGALADMLNEASNRIGFCIGAYDDEYRELTRDKAEPVTA